MWLTRVEAYRFASSRTVNRLQQWAANPNDVLTISKWSCMPSNSCRYMTVQSDSQQPGLIRKALQSLGTLIKAFTLGTKQLYYDLKRMRQLQTTHGKLIIVNKAPLSEPGFHACPFKLEEVQFIYQTKKDLIRMLPAVTLFMVPLIGYIAPVIAFMFPQHLLSQQFWTDELRKELENKECSHRMQHFKKISSDFSKNNIPLLLVNQQPDFSKDIYVTKFPELSSMERSKLVTLSRAWGLFPLLPKSLLQKRLEHHINYIFLCDWLLIQENPTTVSEKALQKFCVERCLNSKEHATNWINVSTHYKECPTSFLAHLPVLFK